MVSALHREPRHPPFGLRLRRKAFSCRLWDAIQAAIGSEDRRSMDDRQVTFFFLIRRYAQRGMPAEAVARLEKAAALSPEPNTMASLAQAYSISGQKGKALKILTQLETKAKKKAFPIISLPQSTLVLVARRRGLQP